MRQYGIFIGKRSGLCADSRYTQLLRPMQIHIPEPRNDLRSNLEKIELLVKELELIQTLFYNRLNIVLETEIQSQENIKKKGIPEPVFSFRSFQHDFSDIEMSVHFKSYLFIIRQAIEKIFKVVFQSKECLNFKNVEKSIPDLSQSGKFTKHFSALINKEYEYDDEIIELFNQWSDIFIVTRLIRNALKTQASFQVWIIDNKEVKIICPLLPRERKDPSIALIKTNMSANGEDLKNFILEPGFLAQGTSMIKLFSELLNKKLKNNCV